MRPPPRPGAAQWRIRRRRRSRARRGVPDGGGPHARALGPRVGPGRDPTANPPPMPFGAAGPHAVRTAYEPAHAKFIYKAAQDGLTVDLESMREDIDGLNAEIISAIVRRLEITRRVAGYKKRNGIPVVDAGREESVVSLFEEEFARRGMKAKTGRIVARALIDAAVVEEKDAMERDAQVVR